MTHTAILNLLTAQLNDDELDPASVRSGDPRTSSLSLETCGNMQRGIWQITPGVVTDEELEETFLVVAGRATVELSDGRRLELAAGVAGRFRAGERTVWHVFETLRKVYEIVLPPTDDQEPS